VKEGGSEGGREGERGSETGSERKKRLESFSSSWSVFVEHFPRTENIGQKTFRTTCSDVFLVADADVRINDVLNVVYEWRLVRH
jgi:hypothetical protein